ncbi:MAG: Rrf2 family transcriptional regulator [Paracoccaceae bacterium]|nr:Rrf2 family transcriptional regulator [Paracoccaceae bacterium]
MRLTSFTDFGLRLLMRMAGTPERSFSTADLAQDFGLSRHHVMKIVQHLSRAGIVETRRGGGGGVRLARAPESILLGEVVQSLEEGQALVECLSSTGGACIINGRCRLKARLVRAEAAFIADLNASTLADIAVPSGIGLELARPPGS